MNVFRHGLLLALTSTLLAPAAFAQKREASGLYAQFCASCHGAKLQGGTSPSMLDDVWRYGGDDATLTRIIREGTAEAGMPAFGGAFSDAEIRALVVFIREQRIDYQRSRTSVAQPSSDAVIKSEQHTFTLETVADGLREPWSLAWLPDGRMLITEKPGTLRIVENGKLLSAPVAGTPEVNSGGQGGLLEVATHPDYAKNGWIYLAFSHPAKNAQGENVSMTKLVRGKIRDGAWTDEEAIWTAPLETYRRAGGVHYGCRIAFDGKGYLYFSHGERGTQEHAQDIKRPNGKIHRIHDDGRIPADNPFVNEPGAIGSIWTFGNRNPQGLDFDPRTGVLWETEHGPRGGDELNIVSKGLNYGWPVITYGMNYNGTPITGETARAGMEQPVIHWTPSIAVCGIDFYEGGAFPKWTGNLFVTALAQQELRRVVIENNQVTHQEVMLKDIARLRDVASGPDGLLYVVMNGPDRIVRLVPVK
ncbi:glucose sorbosone dehydrogenase [Nibricoccus aquaticus]|uniref:Glucose sorbosone dehydrogenase n=1 Tax=Nibricoccus aquaticus TaxID=2576891 RepID=A0A290QGT2_9BACT|nr:PQQ-dependent sugar dehydrogenase [Nibricoccus aquaticus]ATC63561.1 glucose sorbosone dehydrogenase [Nibricoccus aquaticus]